jgi:hypothetical protein
MGETGKVFGIA